MPAPHSLALVAAGVLAASTAGSLAGVTDGVGAGDTVVIEAEFVPFELRDAPGTYLGPIDLQQLFHPGGSGSGTPCTVESTRIEQNEIRLDLDRVTGRVTGSGGLIASCQFNVGAGCEAEQRVVQLEFAGVLDRASGVATGNVSFQSLDSESQIWGTPGGRTGAEQEPSCEFGTYPLPGVGPYETPWLLDLCSDPPAGYFAADLLTGDPLQRFGVFEVTNVASLSDLTASCPRTAEAVDGGAAPSAAAPTADGQATGSTGQDADDIGGAAATPSSTTSTRTKTLAAVGIGAFIVVMMVLVVLLVNRWRGLRRAAADATMALLGDDVSIRD